MIAIAPITASALPLIHSLFNWLWGEVPAILLTPAIRRWAGGMRLRAMMR